jgi:transcriptional regulator with XRE-family HTH domain
MNYVHAMNEDDIKPEMTPQARLQRDLGQRIVSLRKARGWKQEELAKRLGVPSYRLGRWERGLNAPLLEDLLTLKAVLEVTLDELMEGAPASPPPLLAPAERAQLGMFLTGVLRIVKPLMGQPATGAATGPIRRRGESHGA